MSRMVREWITMIRKVAVWIKAVVFAVVASLLGFGYTDIPGVYSESTDEEARA